MADQSVEDHLKAWGLEMYTQKFKEQNITLDVLLLISDEQIKELIPSVGHRVLLSNQLRVLKAVTNEDAPNLITITNDLSFVDASTSFHDFSTNEQPKAPNPQSESSSKPCPLSMDHIFNGNVRLSASEMLTFVRYFGLIIGDCVPLNEQYWSLYTALIKIIDIVMYPRINNDTVELLKCLIGEFNEIYFTLTNQKLKPKFHFLVHYPSFMVKFGPLVNFWAMRFEAKHRTSKISARASFNRRNITSTLAIKHQMQLNEIFLKGHLSKIINVGPIKNISIEKCKEIVTSLSLVSDESLERVAWVKIKGTEYKCQTMLVENIHDLGEIRFMSIKNVYVYSVERIIFECTLLTTVEFDEHFHSYLVEVPPNEEIIYMFYDCLVSYVPCHYLCSTKWKEIYYIKVLFVKTVLKAILSSQLGQFI